MSALGSTSRLFWIDLEMTGLDIKKEVIIECAAIVSDLNFQILDSFEAVVKQPQHYLDQMDSWNRKHHHESGLIAKVSSGLSPEEVENHLISMVKRHFPNEERPILAGNSISQDRLFIDKYWPNFASILHYRTLDITSWKIIFNSKYQIKYQKVNSHRALNDIQESIEELKFYLGYLKI